MTTLTSFWSRLRPWVWPSSEDLNPPARPCTNEEMFVRGRVDRIEDTIALMQSQANEVASIFAKDRREVDAHYIRIASQSFMEHMNRVQSSLQGTLADHRAEIAESIESLNSRLASAETLCGAEIAKLQRECEDNSARIAKLLQQLKFIGGGA